MVKRASVGARKSEEEEEEERVETGRSDHPLEWKEGDIGQDGGPHGVSDLEVARALVN